MRVLIINNGEYLPETFDCESSNLGAHERIFRLITRSHSLEIRQAWDASAVAGARWAISSGGRGRLIAFP